LKLQINLIIKIAAQQTMLGRPRLFPPGQAGATPRKNEIIKASKLEGIGTWNRDPVPIFFVHQDI
jgi:hypothetical protein